MTGQGWKIAIKTSVRRPRKRLKWGDWHFAVGIAEALEAIGHNVRIDCLPEWSRDPHFSDIDINLRGYDAYPDDTGKPHILWVIYPGKKARNRLDLSREYNAADHVMFASLTDGENERLRTPYTTPSSTLMQAFDDRVMFPPEQEKRSGIAFVGSNHMPGHPMRPIVAMALEAGLDVKLYGPGWTGTPAEPHVVQDFLPNDQVGELYRSAQIVLCDHFPSMRQFGYVSNRLFDALACGAPVIVDNVQGLPSAFAPHVWRCTSPDEVRAAYDAILAEDSQEHVSRQGFARSMIDLHSFKARALAIDRIIADILGPRS